MPASCAKALAPTMALFGWTTMPVYALTRRLVRMIWVVSMLVRSPKTCGRVCSAITISSSEVLPARSPMPLIVTSTCRAPFWMAASELAVASPRSSWQCTEMITSSMPGTFSRMPLISPPNSAGVV